MPDWHTELETLLSRLQVSLDHTGQWPPTEALSGDGARSADPDSSGPWDLSALAAEELPVDGDEVSAVRSEIEATVEQVVALVNVGRIETSLRDDVIFVLQALTRPHPSPLAPAEPIDPLAASDLHTEWHLATAAAVLRFCRIVQRLTSALSREAER
jgi:hypothetical protein